MTEDLHNTESQGIGSHLQGDAETSGVFDEFELETGLSLATCGVLPFTPEDFGTQGCGHNTCPYFQASSKQARESCLRIHNQLRENALRKGKACRARCPGGLEHVVVPRFCQGKPVGFLMILGLTHSADQAANVIRFVISHTERAHSGPEAVTHDPANQAAAIPAPLARAIKFAGRHYADPALRESRVAAEVGVTPQRLAQLFQNSFGITYSVWLARKRVAAAEALLRDSRKRIVDIALAVGFGSVASFNRVFRKHTGMTPGECRNGKEPHDRADAP